MDNETHCPCCGRDNAQFLGLDYAGVPIYRDAAGVRYTPSAVRTWVSDRTAGPDPVTATAWPYGEVK